MQGMSGNKIPSVRVATEKFNAFDFDAREFVVSCKNQVGVLCCPVLFLIQPALLSSVLKRLCRGHKLWLFVWPRARFDV